MKQDVALTILKTGANVFLTGEAGSGKTHTVNRYITYLREHGVEPSVTASTGIAATHVHGMTIHSWSGVGIRRYLSDYDLETLSQKEQLVKRINTAKVLIIDEISMLDGKVLSAVEQICRTIRRSNEPFGGIQVIFVGDFFQLPPISKAGEDRAQFAFESDAWKSANPIVCYLTEQHRQEDADFLAVLTAIRRGEVKGLVSETLAEYVLDDDERNDAEGRIAGATKLFTHNVDVDRINIDELGRLDGKRKIFSMRHQGSAPLVETLKRGCLSPEELELKEGARVLFTKNNFEAGYVNGTLGEVVRFDPDNGYPIVKTTAGKTITATPMDWTVEDNGKILAKITQLPLRLAWAITIHKSQGMSMDSAVIDLSRAFEYGQGYVALSRVRSLKGLMLLGLNEKALHIHPHVAHHDELLRKTSVEAEKAFVDMIDAELTLLQHNFLKAMGGTIEKKKRSQSVDDDGAPVKAGSAQWQAKLSKLREKHPNAYRPWTKEDDEHVKDLFSQNYSVAAISKDMGRQPGSIKSRLLKLGLINEDGEAIFG